MTREGVLTRFDELGTFAEGFAARKFNLGILIGKPGLMKSETIRRACSKYSSVHVIGKKSPLDLYLDLFHHRNELVVLDDIDELLRQKDGAALIRQVTETTPSKVVTWGTTKHLRDRNGDDVPHSFETTSPVMIVANRWPKGAIFDAIVSRGLRFDFRPSWKELYPEAAKWFRDQEVLDYVHQHLHELINPDCRLLKKAVDLRTLALPGRDWREVFEPCMHTSRKIREVTRLLALPGLTMNERVEQFVNGKFGDRSTFFRQRKKISTLSHGIPERIIVATSESSSDDHELEEVSYA